MELRTAYLATRKIYSQKGTLLGTVTYPEEWDSQVVQRGGFRIAFFVDKRSIRELLETDAIAVPDVRTLLIVPSVHEKGAVKIIGVSMEEFEQMPFCSFQPGASYIRSLME
jgi:hypothetical protein